MEEALRLIAVIAALAVAGCTTTGSAVETRYKESTRVVRGACPDPDTFAVLKAEKPVPLRDQAMPSDPVARSGAVSAQLGLYEAPGKWVDKAWSALSRCQTEGVDAPK
jgi:hypothetical protein